jgi:hypothetical protein
MATWVDIYNKIRFEVEPRNEHWAIMRVRYLNEKRSFATIVYPGLDK